MPIGRHRAGMLERLFEVPARLLARVGVLRPQRRAAIDPTLERQSIEAVASLLLAGREEPTARRDGDVLVFDSLILVELGLGADEYRQILLVQYFSRFDAFRVDWRERVNNRAVRLGLADFATAEGVAHFVARCSTRYKEATEVADTSEVPRAYSIERLRPHLPRLR